MPKIGGGNPEPELTESDANKIDDLQVLTDRFGTAAYQIYKERLDNKARRNLNFQASEIVHNNQSVVTSARNQVSESVISPTLGKYRHSLSPRQAATSQLLGSLESPSMISETEEMHDLVMKYRNYDGEFPIKKAHKKSKKFRYQMKHNGSSAIKDGRGEIFAQVAEKVLQNKEHEQLMKRDNSTFGLSEAYLNRNVSWDEQRCVVIFIEDGCPLRKAKAFRYNLVEKFDSLRNDLIHTAE